jgi:hypothetical protein
MNLIGGLRRNARSKSFGLEIAMLGLEWRYQGLARFQRVRLDLILGDLSLANSLTTRSLKPSPRLKAGVVPAPDSHAALAQLYRRIFWLF